MDHNTELLQGLSLSKLAPSRINLRTSEGVSSVFQFSIKEDQEVFRYDVEVSRVAGDVERSQTKTGSDDGQKYYFRKICKESMQIIYKRTNNFGGISYVYDDRKNMFTNGVLNVQKVHQLDAKDFGGETAKILKNDKVHIEIQACQTSQHTIKISDYKSSIQTDLLVPADHTLRMFLELVTSQHFTNANTHTIVGMGLLFDNQPKAYIENNNLVLHEGISKGVRIVENDQHPIPALVADVKTCAFFNPITLDAAVNNMNRNLRPDDRQFWNEFLNIYAGVRVAPIYDPGRTFVIGNLTSRMISEFPLEKDGQQISIADYYAKNKNIRLKYLNWPGVRSDSKRDNIYPFEVLRILPFQRITLDKMSDNVSRALLDANTTYPDQRYNQILDKVKLIGLDKGPCGLFMENFGVRLTGNKNGITVKVRAPPNIKYGDKQTVPNNGSFYDSRFKYYRPVSILNKWVVAHPTNINRNDVQDFIFSLIKNASFKGVRLPDPQFMNFSINDMSEQMQQLSQERIQFVTFIDQKFVKSHGLLKLNERRFGILTQHITIEVVRKASRGGGATITNIINKMHMKIAFKEGLNYVPIMEKVALERFDISKGHVLVIGLDSSNAPKASPFERFKLRQDKIDMDSYEPSVIGITSNYVTEPFSFCGTYFYQPSKQDAIHREKLGVYVRWLLTKVKENRKTPPSYVFIIRDGVSEGHVIKNEFTAIKEACFGFSPKFRPKFVLCIVDKSHHKRFFTGNGKKDGTRIDNLVPSSVVDSKIVRPDMPEFYLQSHKPLKGTGNVPQYLFPINQVNANNDELQAFINGLCHAFQIVTLAPSLPAPVLIAHEMAKRGRNNYMELKRSGKVPMIGDSKVVDIERLNTMLSYSEHKFSDTRFNA